jgi:hypothetical protein
MKKLLVGLTLLASVGTFAHSGNDTDSNKICGVEMISLSQIGTAVEEAKVAEAMSDFRSEGALEVQVCNYEEGAAVVATFEKNKSVALIFKN